MRSLWKKTGEIVTIVPHSEPMNKGYALGIGIPKMYDGTTVKRDNGNYAFIHPENEDYFEEAS